MEQIGSFTLFPVNGSVKCVFHGNLNVIYRAKKYVRVVLGAELTPVGRAVPLERPARETPCVGNGFQHACKCQASDFSTIWRINPVFLIKSSNGKKFFSLCFLHSNYTKIA